MELGKAKYSTGKTVFKIEDGDNVYRVLPPMGKLAKAGKWNMYYRVEWGFKDLQGRNKPFQDVRVVNYQTQMVEVESAAHLQREALKAEKADLLLKLRKTPNDVNLKNKMQELNESIKRYNLDSKYYMNVIDLNGKIGLLKVGSRAFKALKAEIDKLRKLGVDPLSIDNGRFFNFNRTNDTGNFQDTSYQVTVYKTKITRDGETYEKDLVHKIDQSIIDRLSEEAFELSEMYPVVTPEEVERMVAEGASAVNEILGGKKDSNDLDPADDDGFGNSLKETAQAAPVSTPLAATKATTTTAAPVKTPTKTVAQEVLQQEEMPDDEFLKMLGVQ